MNPKLQYVFDEDELVFNGKQMREYRDVCRREGYIQALDDVIDLPLKDFGGDVIKQVQELRKDVKEKSNLR